MKPIDWDKLQDELGYDNILDIVYGYIITGKYDLGTCESCRFRERTHAALCGILELNDGTCVACKDISFCGLWERENDA